MRDIMVTPIDIVSTERGFPRLAQYLTTHTYAKYANDFFEWSDYEHSAAMCVVSTEDWEGYEEYNFGLWIIDTETNEVVDKIQVVDEEGNNVGVCHGILSEVYPGRVYLALAYALNNSVIAIDHDTSELIESLPTGGGYVDFLYELPDGRLIVTKGEAGEILIIDPT
jgi:DNA-binding beta-propeller fold protein YncE